ncbi:site-specific integrase [Shewanella decolorationis]|uniref:site-specific integrase n=1 Tax=Shewanella decolorationis TaxID=256839 RepID=UPI001056FAB0|nr:site-specific integrase [Shewanella decolorationis]
MKANYDYDSIEIKMLEYVKYLKEHPQKLWDLELYQGRLNLSYFARKFGMNEIGFFNNIPKRYETIVVPINNMLLSEGVALENETDGGANIRRKILIWWNSLTTKEKLALPVHGNKLKLTGSLFKNVPEAKGGMRYKCVVNLISDIDSELRELGLFNDSYLNVKDRTAARDSDFQSRATAEKERWYNLGENPINSTDDFIEPTEENHYLQIEQAFSWKARDIKSESGKNNFKQACNFFINFIKNEGFDSLVKWNDVLSEYTLLHFRSFLYASDYASKATTLSSVRNTLTKLKQVKGLGFDGYHPAPALKQDDRVTDAYTPIKREYRQKLDDAIETAISETFELKGSSKIFPYLLKLMREVGLNKEVVVELEIDDFERNHHLTNKPCLRYWKDRSTGDKELHLDIFKANLQWLSVKQSKAVSEVYNKVLELTKNIRQNAPENIKNKLFIYESDGQNSLGKIFQLNSHRSTVACKAFQNKYIDGFTFEVTQLRSTLVSELLEFDASIRDIQLLLGHASIEVTMKYLDRLDFNVTARTKLNEALKQIHLSSLEENDTPEVEVKNDEIDDNGIIFKTSLGGCKNILNPPNNVRSIDYIEGSPCGQFNKCLSCSNVIITKSHLPELFAMQRDFLKMLTNDSIKNTPYSNVVEENLSVLNSILDEDNSEFDKSELEIAKQASTYIDVSESLGMM